MKKTVLLFSMIALGACDPSARQAEMAPGPSEMAPVDIEDAPAPQQSECAVIESRNWQAWVNAMPGPDATPTLHVTGEIVLPTPGYTIEWQLGALDRMLPPGQRLSFTTIAPEGMVTQVLTTVEVAYAGETAITDYREVMVSCGDKVLATISDVVIAQ